MLDAGAKVGACVRCEGFAECVGCVGWFEWDVSPGSLIAAALYAKGQPAARNRRGYADFFIGCSSPSAGVAAEGAWLGRFVSGTRNIVWQNWHFTRRPRTSSGTDRIFRQRRLGQLNWQGIGSEPPVPYLSVTGRDRR